jgi:hypothetical protein
MLQTCPKPTGDCEFDLRNNIRDMLCSRIHTVVPAVENIRLDRRFCLPLHDRSLVILHDVISHESISDAGENRQPQQ